ncbi:MAG: hypothetical protein N2314_06150 [Brevinematales bacterium]|nr:hypothetical protein [Brevinematales bacterium]
MKRFLSFGIGFLLFSCGQVEVSHYQETVTLRFSQTVLRVVFPSSPSPEEVTLYSEFFRRLVKLEQTGDVGELRVSGDRYQDLFLMGNRLLKNWKNLTLRWAWIQQVWETMRWEAEKSSLPWASLMKEEMLSYARVRDFEDLFQKYRLTSLQIREARKYLIQFLSVEVYFVSLQELMERYGRYYTMNDLPTVFFQIVVLPESVEWLEFLQKRYGERRVKELARLVYEKKTWEKRLGKPVSDLESEFVKGLENRKFTLGIWTNLDFVHEYQNLLSFYNRSTKSTLFKK